MPTGSSKIYSVPLTPMIPSCLKLLSMLVTPPGPGLLVFFKLPKFDSSSRTLHPLPLHETPSYPISAWPLPSMLWLLAQLFPHPYDRGSLPDRAVQKSTL